MLHKEILNQEQLDLLPILKEFRRSFYLVGGTAIALQIGHRRSIDFDLFSEKAIQSKKIIDKFNAQNIKPMVTRRVEEQLNLMVNNVKFTFFQFPFSLKPNLEFEAYIKMPDLLQLSAMKAYALGRRSKWKDYVDLYFILKFYHSIEEIAEQAKKMFADLFSEKQFRAQLMYFDDIDFTEEIEYITAPIPETEIKETLKEFCLQL